MTENTSPTPLKRPRFTSRVAFLARSEDIKSLLEKGLGLKGIYVELGLDSSMTYPHFGRLAQRFYPTALQFKKPVAKPQPASSSAPVSAQPAPTLPDFDFQPDAPVSKHW